MGEQRPANHRKVPQAVTTKDFAAVRLQEKAIDEARHRVTGIVSSSIPDRDRTLIISAGIETATYLRNPVVLWSHQRGQNVTPDRLIGRCVSLGLTADGMSLRATIEYAVGSSPLADRCWALVRSGFLAGFSIGAIVRQDVTPYSPRAAQEALPDYARAALRSGEVDVVYSRTELVEISQVLLPSCPAATLAASLGGHRPSTSTAPTPSTDPTAALVRSGEDRARLRAIGRALGEHLAQDYHDRRPRMGQRDALAAVLQDLSVDPAPLVARALAGRPQHRHANALDPRQAPLPGIAADERELARIGERMGDDLCQVYSGFGGRIDLTLAALRANPRRFTDRANR